jgi:hypothetical protein
MAQLQSTRIPFVLRDVPGSVHVDYGVNNDPAAWGYELLTSPYDAEISRGCPVMQATVAHPAQGYAAQLGWIQILDWGVPGQQEKIVDRPPQMADAGIPWAVWGTRPTFFDAPSTARPDFTFRAYAFLAYSPDAVITQEAVPLCGFSWGFEVVDGRRTITPLDIDGLKFWPGARSVLGRGCPAWTFLEAVADY